MSKLPVTLLRGLLWGAMVLLACNLPNRLAPSSATPPPAVAVPDEPTADPTPTASPRPQTSAGATIITGRFTYTNDIITVYYTDQAVALVDLYGFVLRDPEWEVPIESQTLGYLSLDPRTQQGEYRLPLPARPSGTFVDLDHDGQTEIGVQVFAVAYWPNLIGGPYSEGDDPSHGWPTYLASVKTDSERQNEIVGGKLVVWAPNDAQQFPTGFGADGRLFTRDDPLGPIPAGYSIVDLDQEPFGISQTSEPEVELHEPADVAIKDYSRLTYTEAFDQLYAKASAEWAFNGAPGKEVDWEALYDRIAPRVAEAQNQQDALAFYRALHAFVLSIPDGHTGLSGGRLAQQDFFARFGGGYGFAVHELDDGKVIVVYVLRGGPAAEAGMRVGAQITAFNAQDIGRAIGSVEPYFGPYSLPSHRRRDQAIFLPRGPVGVAAEVTFVNPGGAEQAATLTSTSEIDSLLFGLGGSGDEPLPVLPVESRVLDSGAGYIRVHTSFDDLGLILRLFERALRVFQENGVAHLMIDLRQNAGGAHLGLAGYLTGDEIVLGQLEYYSAETGRFEPDGVPAKIRPFTAQYRFEKLAVLVGPDCASACEMEAYGFAQLPGALIVGMYPTAGTEAEVARGQFRLPEGLTVQIPTGRFVKPDGSLFIEGQGITPTVKVPVNERTVLATEDVELQAAEDALLGVSAQDYRTEGGLTLGAPEVARAALQAGTPLLDALAPEIYDSAELEEVGRTFTYTVTLNRDQRLLWQLGWCATSPAILEDNFENLTIRFAVNGAPVDLDRFAVLDTTSGDLYCKTYFTVVYRWPVGQTRLESIVTFNATVNDGLSDYPPGSQSFLYVVTRR